MAVIILWTLVGLFWAAVAANAYINKSDTRKAWRKRAGERVAFAIFDAAEWVWTTVLRRKPFRRQISSFDSHEIEMWLLSKGVRSTVIIEGDSGRCQIRIHPDDEAQLKAVFDELGLPLAML